MGKAVSIEDFSCLEEGGTFLCFFFRLGTIWNTRSLSYATFVHWTISICRFDVMVTQVYNSSVHGPSGREPTRASEESEEEDNAHVC